MNTSLSPLCFILQRSDEELPEGARWPNCHDPACKSCTEILWQREKVSEVLLWCDWLSRFPQALLVIGPCNIKWKEGFWHSLMDNLASISWLISLLANQFEKWLFAFLAESWMRRSTPLTCLFSEYEAWASSRLLSSTWRLETGKQLAWLCLEGTNQPWSTYFFILYKKSFTGVDVAIYFLGTGWLFFTLC